MFAHLRRIDYNRRTWTRRAFDHPEPPEACRASLIDSEASARESNRWRDSSIRLIYSQAESRSVPSPEIPSKCFPMFRGRTRGHAHASAVQSVDLGRFIDSLFHFIQIEPKAALFSFTLPLSFRLLLSSSLSLMPAISGEWNARGFFSLSPFPFPRSDLHRRGRAIFRLPSEPRQFARKIPVIRRTFLRNYAEPSEQHLPLINSLICFHSARPFRGAAKFRAST